MSEARYDPRKVYREPRLAMRLDLMKVGDEIKAEGSDRAATGRINSRIYRFQERYGWRFTQRKVVDGVVVRRIE